MKTFKDYLGSKLPTRKMLGEGGNAIKKSSRINQKNVKATLASIYTELLPKLGITKKETVLLGSTGKKDPAKNGSESGSSGDIDLAIDMTKLMDANSLHSKEEVFEFLKVIGKDYPESASFIGLDVHSIAFPITNEDGLQSNKFVQLDLMPVENLDYAKWSYHSPAFDESKYKALYPKEIYYACARHAKFDVTEGTEDSPITWNRYFFDLAKGLLKGSQTLKSKSGNIVKKAESFGKEVYSTNPNEIVKILFGPAFKKDDVLTWEQCWDVIHSKDFKHKAKLKEILSMVKDGILKKGYPLPPELD